MTTKKSKHLQDIPAELRQLVKQSVALFGEVLRDELGENGFHRIEAVRKRMAGVRRASHESVMRELEKTFRELTSLSGDERRDFARAYTLMFELMNACENAYRTWRLKQRPEPMLQPVRHESISYVMTAHPTEARSPASIQLFHDVQGVLVECLSRGFDRHKDELKALLALTWQVPIMRSRKPKVQDESAHILSVLLREDNLSLVLDFSREWVPIDIRSWVGGDKDGHPGVNEKTLFDSLQQSREGLRTYAKNRIEEIRSLLALAGQSPELDPQIQSLLKSLRALRLLRSNDGARMEKFRSLVEAFSESYRLIWGTAPLALVRLERLLEVFPGLVVPMELREDSGLLMSDPSGESLAIGRMLKRVARLAGGRDPRWYARSLIISMTQNIRHLEVAGKISEKILGDLWLPIVPLFEQKQALEDSAKIVSELIESKFFKRAIRDVWGNRVEIMLGYSDSSKESGVLASRLLVTEAMNAIDRVMRKKSVAPVFFHGSGGSIDRGGGSVSDQMAAWPRSARIAYKATIQGEMVERTFSSPEIARSRFFHILRSAQSTEKKRVERSKALDEFAERVGSRYRETIASERFLRMVERATPYRYLSALKIGSRPSKRSGSLSVPALRAIPWVLCWTQTRVLFQTWWGVGAAWKNTSVRDRASLRRAYRENPLFATYLKALGFTLAKVEIPVWDFYLARAGLSENDRADFSREFRDEFQETLRFFRDVTGQREPLWFRPWLGESIELRAAMIHPLNLLQIIAQEKKDLTLLRICVTGISSGMLTTG